MKKLRFLSIYVLASLTLIMLTNCSDEDTSPFSTVSLTFQSAGTNSFNTARMANGKSSESNVVITDFRISIRDVVFKTDVDDNGIEDDSTEVAFRGPYLLDLLDSTDALSQSIGDAEVPKGVYSELRFKLHKSEDVAAGNPLFDRSIYLKGTLDGIPFDMWHDTSENLDVGKSTGVVVDDVGVSLTVSFNIEQFMSSAIHIDLTQATDGDGDGVIEINPNDEDGNKEIADALKENIKAAADLINH